MKTYSLVLVQQLELKMEAIWTLTPNPRSIINFNLITFAAKSEIKYKFHFISKSVWKTPTHPKHACTRLLNRLKNTNMNALKQKCFRLLVSRALFRFRWVRKGVVRCCNAHVNVTLRAWIQVISIKEITGRGLHIHLKWMLPFTVSVCIGSVNKQAKEVKTTGENLKGKISDKEERGNHIADSLFSYQEIKIVELSRSFLSSRFLGSPDNKKISWCIDVTITSRFETMLICEIF